MATKFPPDRFEKTKDSKMNMNMKNMFNGSKIFERMFRKADGVVWDLMTGKIGIQTDDGIVTLDGDGDDAQVNLNLFDDFGFALPAFAQSTPVANVQVGDIIYRGSRNNVAWVIGKNEDKGTFKLMKPNGETVGWTAPKVQMLGFESGVMVLRSLATMLPGGDKDMSQMQNLLMPMLMFGDGEFGQGDMMDKLMPMMLMGMMNGNGNNLGNMMPMIMMMNMMKGK